MPKYVLEEKKGKKWKRVGAIMDTSTAKGKFAFGMAKAVLKRTSAKTRKNNRLRRLK